MRTSQAGPFRAKLFTGLGMEKRQAKVQLMVYADRESRVKSRSYLVVQGTSFPGPFLSTDQRGSHLIPCIILRSSFPRSAPRLHCILELQEKCSCSEYALRVYQNK